MPQYWGTWSSVPVASWDIFPVKDALLKPGMVPWNNATRAIIHPQSARRPARRLREFAE
jgi:hypothetical protein